MATYRAVGTGGGSSGTGNRTADIIALAGDHLTCFVQWAGNTATNPTCTDNQSGTYDLITTALCNASADIQACFVRRLAVATAATITVTPVVGSGSNTSGEVFVIACAGMMRMGTNSVRQSARQQNQTSGVPTPVFGSSALTGNLTIQCQGASNGTANALSVPATNWQERADAGQTANVSNLAISTRDSGFTGTSAAYVSTTATLWNSTFVELDTTVPDFAYFDKEQWPVPEGHKVSSPGKPVITQKTWTQNLQQTTLAPTLYNLPRSPLTVQRGQRPYPYGLTQGNLLDNTLGQVTAPFSETDWPVPRGVVFNAALQRWETNTLPLTNINYVNRAFTYRPSSTQPRVPTDVYQNLLGTTLGGVQAPFVPIDWANPRPLPPNLDLRTWTENTTYLIGQDTLPEPNLNWPNPRGPQHPQQHAAGTLLTMLLLHPVAQHDWPNPRGPMSAVDLRTWLETTVGFIGQDTLPGLNRDWPVPRGYTPLVRDWIDKTRIQLIGQDTLPFQNQWANPRGPSFSLRDWINAAIRAEVQNPFFQTDWPNPKGYTTAIDLKTWVENITYLIGLDQLPVLNMDWPNPRGKIRPQHPFAGTLLATLYGFVQPPFAQLDWPVPNGPRFPLDLRTWLETALRTDVYDTLRSAVYTQLRQPVSPIELRTWISGIAHLITQIQLPELNYDWPVPKGDIPAIALATWINQLQQQLIGKDALPFNQDNWPVPWSTKPNQWPPLNPFNPNLPPTPPTPGEDLRQRIRFAPIAFGGKTHWTR